MTNAEALQLAREYRVRKALAEYKNAQRQQAMAVQRHNDAITASLDAVHATATGGPVVPALMARARSLQNEAAIDLMAAAVFDAAAELVDALDAAGFGQRSESQQVDKTT